MCGKPGERGRNKRKSWVAGRLPRPQTTRHWRARQRSSLQLAKPDWQCGAYKPGQIELRLVTNPGKPGEGKLVPVPLRLREIGNERRQQNHAGSKKIPQPLELKQTTT